MNYGGKVTLTNSTVSGNTAGRGGGAVVGFYFTSNFEAATLKVQKSTISGNTATGAAGGPTGFGGGVMLYQRGALTLIDSTISGNHAATDGGGVGTHTWYEEGSLSVTNSTITGNSAGQEGGGVFVEGASSLGSAVTLQHALLTGNSASTVPEMATGLHIVLTVDDYNLFGSNGDAGVSGFTPGATDIVPAPGTMVSDILGPLASNGGPTLTHALVSDGPAVDAVPTSDGKCVGTSDQRGVPRPQGPGCDTGAFELEAR
jgi:hypothetical protein